MQRLLVHDTRLKVRNGRPRAAATSTGDLPNPDYPWMAWAPAACRLYKGRPIGRPEFRLPAREIEARQHVHCITIDEDWERQRLAGIRISLRWAQLKRPLTAIAFHSL